MGNISVNSFNRYDINPKNVRGKFTPDEIMAGDEAFTKTFLEADHKVQIKILNNLSPEAKDTLFTSLRKHYRSAQVDPLSVRGDTSKTNSEKALFTVAVNMIITSRQCKDVQDIIINTLRFMHSHIDYQNKAKDPGQRDACEWSGPRVLAEGNFNGCVEADKAFISLFREAVSQKGLSSVKSNYISSFEIRSATWKDLEENIKPGKCQPGHALAEISYKGDTFLVNATAMEDDLFGGENISFKDLKDRSIIKYADNEGDYLMQTRQYVFDKFKLFGRGITYDVQTNPHDPFDRSTSDGATRVAVKDYLNSLK
jgi:hypothetical protein